MGDDAEPAFPAAVVMKVILPGAESAFEESRAYLLPLIEEEAGTPRGWDCRASGKGRYLSLTFTVDLDSREHLERLYGRLQGLERVKMVL